MRDEHAGRDVWEAMEKIMRYQYFVEGIMQRLGRLQICELIANRVCDEQSDGDTERRLCQHWGTLSWRVPREQ